MVIVNIENNTKKELNFNIDTLTKKVIKSVLLIEKVDLDVSVNVTIDNSSKVRNINKKERGIDKTTDVLSFPNIEFKKPANFKPYINKNEIDVSIIDLTNKTIYLGDILINIDKVLSQSKMYGHSIKREYAFLLTHSMLHLLGYDHMNEKDEKKMFKKQDNILETININR